MATANRTNHLTDEQHRAIFERDASIALSAGAGCGKTFVLTERFLTSISPADGNKQNVLSDLVAITFTDRAAREMRDRIRAKCHQRLMNASPEEASQWLEIYRHIDSARVSTIHAFCASLLRQYPVESNLDPSFTVLDDAATETLLAETIDTQLRDNLAQRDEATLDLMVDYSLRELRIMLGQFITARHSIDFEEWSGRSPEEITQAWLAFHESKRNLIAMRKLVSAAEIDRVKRVINTIEPVGDVMAQRFATLRATFAELGDTDRLHEHLQILQDNAQIKGASPAKDWPDPSERQLFQKEAEKLRKRIKAIQDVGEFDPVEALPVAKYGLQLLEVTRDIVAAYEARKQQLAALDFDDLMIRTKQLLTSTEHPHVSRRVAAGIEHLLIDEFQDTNQLQVELVEALCGERKLSGKLFIVGDFKQSIYRFRQAEPKIFRTLREEMPEGGRLSLTQNFRSQPAILDFVNALFCEPMGVSYEPLHAFRQQVSPTPAIEFLWATVSGDDAKIKNRQDKTPVGLRRKHEADWIARRIRQMLDNGEPIVWDSSSKEPAARPPRLGDFALLFRALSDVELYESALREYGLDYYLVGGRAFYAQQEIYDLVNLLRTLASEADEVSLVGVLRSPFFSLSDDTLFWLGQHPEGLAAGLFTEELHPAIEKEQQRRAARAAAVIRELRSKKDRLSITALIQESLRLTGYDAALLAEFLGERKLANLYKLIDSARRFDSSGMFTLNDFVVQLAEFIAKQPAEPLAATMPESTEVIRLMTIHQSKGLEFPIVIVPDLDRKPHADSNPAAFHPELGPLVKSPSGSKMPTGLDLYRQVEELEGEDETTRLLYVATTRAADYLMLSAGVEAVDRPESPWRRVIERRFELDTGEMLGELPPGYTMPEVKVTLEKPELPNFHKESSRGVKLEKVIGEIETARKGKPRPPETVGPIAPHRAARRQFSFSRLTGALKPQESPAVEAETALVSKAAEVAGPRDGASDPLLLGSLVHAALAQWPGLMSEGNKAAAAPEQLVQLQADKLHIAGSVLIGDARDLVRGFVSSPRAEALLAAQEVHAEIEFMLPWPPRDETSSEGAATRWIGGVIDCLYQSPDGVWHLLDYKTNQLTGRGVEEVANPYRMQMLLYALAIEQSLGTQPGELCLHFLRGGVEHIFELDESSREWVVGEVNRAMDLLVS